MSSVAIRSIEFENYRCLSKARLEFGPLTVLVGGNGTGKSSVLQALMCDQSGLREEDITGRSPKKTIHLRIQLASGDVVSVSRSRSGTTGAGALTVSRQLLRLDVNG